MSDLLIKLIGELSKLKYSHEKYNQLNIQYAIKSVRGNIVLEGIGNYNGIPMKVEITFKNAVTQDMIVSAYDSFLRIMDIIHVNSKLMKKLVTSGVTHNLVIKIEVSKSAVVKYTIITKPISANHEVNLVEKESKFHISVKSVNKPLAKTITVLLTNPIRIYPDNQLLKIRELIYSLLIVANAHKEMNINHKFSTGNVVIMIKDTESGFQRRAVIKFSDLMLMTPRDMVERVFKRN